MPGVNFTSTLASGKKSVARRWAASLSDHAPALAVSPDGNLLAAGTLGGEVVLIDAERGRTVRTLEGHVGGTLAAGFSPDGALLATSGVDGNVHLHQLDSERFIPVAAGGKWVEQLAWSSDGTLFASGADRELRFWSRDGRLVGEAQPHASTISALSFAHGTTRAVTACYGGVFVHQPEKRKPVKQYEWKGSIVALAARPDGAFIAVGTQEASVMVFSAETGKPVEMTGFPGKVRALAWSPSGQLLATSSSLEITLWSFQGRGPAGRKPEVLRGLQGRATGLAFASEHRVVSSCDDGAFRVHRRSNGWKLEASDDAGAPLLSLALAPDGSRAFGSAKDGRLRCWDLGT
jgi:WD40 repeat protein